ncbi:unnamed protein product [Ranitomeya imitator]|uniref:Regulator of cell cycle n=1 Tax=Ranitomeya imitator TaxID=111125 RepID=A0ABN9LFG3_9NEOB|nr:unnamed protein product [Ranitomeya imitator]
MKPPKVKKLQERKFTITQVILTTFIEDDDLNEVLCEFDAVLEDFSSPFNERRFRYDEHLQTMKRRSSTSISDSGISDSESADSLCRNSFSFSDEKLNSPTLTSPPLSSPAETPRKDGDPQRRLYGFRKRKTCLDYRLYDSA